MTTEELEKTVARHEMQCLELKEPFNAERAVDEYIAVLKSAGALRRKDGKRFGAWEIMM